jgi:uncharacterized membrane protein YgdD (TMEM256/DUF423 family)
MSQLTARLLAFLSCLLGAFGVALAAAASHVAPGKSLESAATIAMVTAPAVLAMLAMTRTGLIRPTFGLISAVAAWAGAWLFSGAVALRAFAPMSDWAAVHMLATIPMIAPVGGTLLIGAWVLAAVAALFR